MRRWRRPVTIPYTNPQHLPLTIDEERCRCAWYSEHRRHFCIHIQQVRKSQSVLGNIGFYEVQRFAHIDTEHHESLVFIALMERFESGPLSQTVGSPGSPKVHEYHLSLERPQGHFLAFQIRQTDLW
jgi:hypothetical protein